MRPAAVAAAAVAAAALAALGAARAAPVVEVRGRPAIALDPIRRAGDGIEVRGQVTEHAGGEPLPDLDLTIELGGETAVVTTDAEGRFGHRLPAAAEVGALIVDFAGEPALAPARIALERFDVAKRPLSLEVRAESSTDGAPRIRVLAHAHDDVGPVALTAIATIGPIDGAAPPPFRGALTTGGDGDGELEVPLAQVGGPGRKRVVLEFAGDDARDPARAEAALAAESASALDLALDDDAVRFEGRLAGGGRLRDAAGAGLAGRSIAIEGKGRTLADALTDDRGDYRFSIAASEVGAGPLTLQASFASDVGYLGSSRSDVVAASVAERRPVPVGLMLAAFAATAGAVAAFLALRTRPWERWRGAPAAAPTDGDAPAALPAAGLVPARPGLVDQLRRPHDLGFAGRVRAAVGGSPIAGATIVVEPAGVEPRRAESDALGGFALEALPPGDHPVTVAAAGHVTERFVVAIPHRGELRDARVDLVPVRERIFAIYREVAEPLLAPRARWGVATPRQIVDAVRARRPAPALADLTDYVEEKYFSNRIPDEAELPTAAARAERVRAERA